MSELTIDEQVKIAIQELLPGGSEPDKENYLPDGSQYKAPDHASIDLSMLIERKAITPIDDGRYFHRLTKIGDQRGWQGGAYGIARIDRLIAGMPDPDAAYRSMVEWALNGMMGHLTDARKKFEQHKIHNSAEHALRIVIVSDHSTIPQGNAWVEHFLGHKMGAFGKRHDKTGLIDAIFVLKSPLYIFDEDNSYWFKCLIKRRVVPVGERRIVDFAVDLHNTIAIRMGFDGKLSNLRKGRFQPLIVG